MRLSAAVHRLCCVFCDFTHSLTRARMFTHAAPHSLTHSPTHSHLTRWNSWNLAACNINESFFRMTVDQLAANGFKEAGYEYVNLGLFPTFNIRHLVSSHTCIATCITAQLQLLCLCCRPTLQQTLLSNFITTNTATTSS
jgi:hypothetical protein